MHILYAILFLLLLAGCAGRLGPGARASTPIQGPIRMQADEFQRLRGVKGHFSGGEWNDEVDRWMGKKHGLMVALGEQISRAAYSTAQVSDLLGVPDAIARQGSDLYGRIRARPDFVEPPDGVDAFLVYHWRGERDFLYLTARRETIAGSGWWYTGE